MACEYHQPLMSIRQKENALNLACSFLRPMDPTLKEVIADAMLSTKKVLNMKSGQQMLNDLAFYEIDVDYLGDVSDDEGGGAKNEEDVLNEKEKLMKMSLQDGEEKELNPMEAALQVFSEEYRKDDMMKAAEQEMSINEYKVEPATNQCLTDFYIPL